MTRPRCGCHYSASIWLGYAVRKTHKQEGKQGVGRFLMCSTRLFASTLHIQEIMTVRPLQLHGLLLLVLASCLGSQAVVGVSASSPPPSSSRSPPRASLSAFAFASSASSSSFFPTRARHHPQQRAQGRQRRSASLQMRDASMTRDFTVGDIVRIEPGVKLDGMDWGGLEGTVTTTWVK